MKSIFSGVQPSGVIHIGNYLGAIRRWSDLQNEADRSIFCVVDLHALTVKQDSKEFSDLILSVASMYLASGIDPNKSNIFVQSDVMEHASLCWLLNCVTKIGELNRMTQFKEKSGENREGVSVGLFDYPVLMASDILLYQTTHVPVGDDQKQHLELTRDLAIRFNSEYGETFVVPEPIIFKGSSRIMGLDEPNKKMSKSALSQYNYISMTDDDDTIVKKISRAVTDSGNEISFSADKPAISNLLTIYSEFSGEEIDSIVDKFRNRGYGEFKKALSEVVVSAISPIREKYFVYMSDKESVRSILKDGADKVRPIASETYIKAKKMMGMI